MRPDDQLAIGSVTKSVIAAQTAASTPPPLRVVYELRNLAEEGHFAVSITTVRDLVRDGGRDHSWADPPVGPSVEDLASALAALASRG